MLKADNNKNELEVAKSDNLANYQLDRFTQENLRRVIDDGTPPNTKRAYKSDMSYFWTWCSVIGWADEVTLPVPSDIVAKFIADHLEGLEHHIDEEMVERGVKRSIGPLSISTIDRRISSLSTFHKTKSLPSPCNDGAVIQLMSKARKASARRGFVVTKKKAIVKDILVSMVDTCSSDSVIDIRDKAILYFGWSTGGRRRSEIAAAEISRLEERNDDYVYHMGISKTDQEGEGLTLPIAGKAASAMRDWLEVSEITDGPIFRSVDRHSNIRDYEISDRAIALIVKKRAKLAGLDARRFSGHSLRSGFLTESGIQGKNLLDAMKLSGHKTVQVAASYHQAGSALLNETADLAG